MQKGRRAVQRHRLYHIVCRRAGALCIAPRDFLEHCASYGHTVFPSTCADVRHPPDTIVIRTYVETGTVMGSSRATEYFRIYGQVSL